MGLVNGGWGIEKKEFKVQGSRFNVGRSGD
jgi:hypothetical protein